MVNASRRIGSANLWWGAATVAMSVYLWFVGIPCPFYEMTGIYCPGCGATRGVKALAHGNVALALHENAWFFLFALPGMALALALGRWWPESRTHEFAKRYMVVAALAAIPFTILRNIPSPPFTLLAPIGK